MTTRWQQMIQNAVQPAGRAMTAFAPRAWWGLLVGTALAVASHPTAGLAQEILVADGLTNSVQRYDATAGTFLGTFASGGGLSGPYGLAFGPDGNLYVSSFSSNQVLKYSRSTGAFLGEFAAANRPFSIAFGSDGDLYVQSDTGGISRFDGSTGAALGIAIASPGPANETFFSMAIGPGDVMYVGGPVSGGGSGSISRYDYHTGTFLGEFATGFDDGPRMPIWDVSGDLLSADMNDGVVRKFNGTTGASLGVFADPPSNGNVAIVEAAGYLFVSGVWTQAIYRHNATTGALIDTPITGVVSSAMLARPAAVCADGYLDTGEQCDDGNAVSGDGCDATCQWEPGCAGGMSGTYSGVIYSLTFQWNVIDDGSNTLRIGSFAPGVPYNSPAGATSFTLTRSGNALSGSGFTGTIDSCGQMTLTDGFSPFTMTRTSTSTCGNGTQEAGEYCDDGNFAINDACDISCLAPFCGNASQEPGEECDDANAFNNDACKTNCTLNICGDGVRNEELAPGYEICDDGNVVDGDSCDSNCSPTGCGNGIVTAGETCDDGDWDYPTLQNGDGCSTTCTVEPGWNCSGTPSTCTPPPHTWTVDSTTDEPDATAGNGICASTPSGSCTLRAAIDEAVARNAGDTVSVPGGTYTLTQGALWIDGATAGLTIAGGGSDVTAIEGDVFNEVVHIGHNSDVTIEDVLVINGGSSGIVIESDAALQLRRSRVIGNQGGGIFNEGALLVDECEIAGNISQQDGGGISNYDAGYAAISRSEIRNNRAANGGGIYNGPGPAASMVLLDSMLRQNQAENEGGGLYSDGTLTVAGCAVVENYTEGSGGGLRLVETADITNTTIHANWATFGGGVSADSPAAPGSLLLANATITDNAANDGAGIGLGGGIEAAFADELVVRNSIIAGNSSASAGPDCSGQLVSEGYNLIGNTSGCTFSGDITGHLTGVPANLASAGNHGGPTWTRALLPGSPAIDAGNDLTCEAVDQRGITRPQGSHCDIGAFEFTGCGDGVIAGGEECDDGDPWSTNGCSALCTIEPGWQCSGEPSNCSLIPVTWTVDSTLDEDGDPTGTCTSDTSGVCTLRVAIKEAQMRDAGDTIAVPAGTYALANDPLWISNYNGFTIEGADANTTIIEGAPFESVVIVDLDSHVTIRGVTIRNGANSGVDNWGGFVTLEDCIVTANADAGIRNTGTTSVTNCTISANGDAGIWNRDNGDLWVENSTVIGNTGIMDGGGIRNEASATVLNSVITGNHADGDGGGIFNGMGNSPDFTLVNSTVSDNDASAGAGIHSRSGTLEVESCTVTGNQALSDGGGLFIEGAASVVNSTISGNQAAYGGGILSGMADAPGSLLLNNVTIADNVGDDNGSGVGGGLSSGADPDQLTIRNSIIAGNSAAQLGPDCEGQFVSEGYNLIGDSADCTFSGDTTGHITGVSPNLGPLQDNGGPTFTHALLAGSPARDAGDDLSCEFTDQRGINRPQGAACDIGAFEAEQECGNTSIEPGEACDDGNTVGGDGCSAACQLEATPTPTLTPTATPTHTPTPTPTGSCAGSLTGTWSAAPGPLTVIDQGTTVYVVVGPGYAIPPSPFGHYAIAYTRSGAALTAPGQPSATIDSCTQITLTLAPGQFLVFTRTSTQACGDGTPDAGEQCDDGNVANGDGCSIVCTTPACGDGWSDPGETCDDGNSNPNDACKNDCTNNVCGDGVRRTGVERCDYGNPAEAAAGCTPSCQWTPKTFTVDSTADEFDASIGDGICAAAGGGCTLRAAIDEANTRGAGDTIVLPAGTFALSNGRLAIYTDLTLVGAARDTTVIDGNFLDRVLDVGSTTTISDLTITNGLMGGDCGGGIWNEADLTLNNVRVAGNAANDGGGICGPGALTLSASLVETNQAVANGGGIHTIGGTLMLSDSTIRNNLAGEAGGGVYAEAATVTISQCEVSGNTADTGGGIFSSGDLQISDTAVRANQATTFGGGVGNVGVATIERVEVSSNSAGVASGGVGNASTDQPATLTIINSTISGNTADGAGGVGNSRIPSNGPYANDVILHNVTITNNSAGAAGAGGLGTLYGTVTIGNSIIAGNTVSGTIAPDCGGVLTSEGHNLIQNTLYCTITGNTTGNIIGVNPLLGPLQDNGGPTQTHALLAGCPAFDAGSCTEAVDQRSIDRPQGAACDIGAFEVDAVCGNGNPEPGEDCDDGNSNEFDGCTSQCAFGGTTFTVDTTADGADVAPGDGLCATSGGACTLRAAIQEAEARAVGDAISLPAGTYVLVQGFLDLGATSTNQPLLIMGAGAGLTILDGGGLDSVIVVRGATTATVRGITVQNGMPGGIENSGTLTIEDCTITGNHGAAGGGILNWGTLTVRRCVISGNASEGDGGGIGNDGAADIAIEESTIAGNTAIGGGGGGLSHIGYGTLTVQHTTISGNTANNGGGVFTYAAATFGNVTISGNQAQGFGGGLYATPGVFAGVTLNNCTVTNNRADSDNNANGEGGGLFTMVANELGVSNSIVAGNNGPIGPDCSVGFLSGGRNLIGNASDCAISVYGGGPDLLNVDPKLGSLQDNGGLTFTHALLSGSPAIQGGARFTDPIVNPCEATDQRGLSRPQGPFCDIGAFEATQYCGNGALESGEQCDDGDQIAGNGCETDCTRTPIENVPVSAGGTVTSDVAGTGATPEFPGQLAITSPVAGTISMSTPAAGDPNTSSFAVLGQPLDLTAPTASAANPLVLVFTLDASVLPSGVDPLTIALFRNGAIVPDCTGAAGEASPDPCVDDRTLLGSGDLQITALSSAASEWDMRVVARDSVTLPLRPLSVTFGALASSPTMVTKTVRVTVRNASAASQDVRLVANRGDCPAGIITGLPNFAATGAPVQDNVLLAGGRSKAAVVKLSLNRDAFLGFNKKTPKRCTMTFTSQTLFPGGSVDPTPGNNVAILELNVIDASDTQQTTTHESYVTSLAPLSLIIGDGKTSTKRNVRVTIGNGDVAETSTDLLTLSASDGDCPAGSVGFSDFALAPGPQTGARVKGGMSKGGPLPITVYAGRFATPNGKSPARCTALITVTGPGGSGDPTNDTTRLVIDVVDFNDY
ncbi:MAG: right-handed parallel beta-helix repeat-containing protein [Deltaproteobacteria bacterium]|nr:right-handed parallel beta-helix repeat-containing protein [Deltaproteobacteria bacterium]